MCRFKKFVPICCLLPILIAACVSGPAAGGPDKLHGRWTNQDYVGTYWTHTFTWYPDGRSIWFEGNDIDRPTGEGRFDIDRRWVDREGYTWYRLVERGSYDTYNEEVARANKGYTLVRINPDGNVAEMEGNPANWPSEFGALGGYHFVYYRLRGAALLHGGWVDRAFVGQTIAYRYRFRADGSALAFSGPESGTPNLEGRYEVVKTWADEKGYTWYHLASRWDWIPYHEEAASGNRWFGLVRLSPDGLTMEIESNQLDFPPAFGAMGNLHRTFQRE